MANTRTTASSTSRLTAIARAYAIMAGRARGQTAATANASAKAVMACADGKLA